MRNTKSGEKISLTGIFVSGCHHHLPDYTISVFRNHLYCIKEPC